MDIQTHRFTWQGILIEVIYDPLKWNVTAHLEIRSITPERAPLPITETGYKSHFHAPGMIEGQGGDVVDQVTAWLDAEAAKPAWRAYAEANRQGKASCFECSALPRQVAPVPRHDKLTRPDTEAIRFGGALFRLICAITEARVINRPASTHHCAAYVRAIN